MKRFAGCGVVVVETCVVPAPSVLATEPESGRLPAKEGLQALMTFAVSEPYFKVREQLERERERILERLGWTENAEMTADAPSAP